MIIWWSDEDEAFVVDIDYAMPATGANAEEAVTVWIETAKADGIKVPSPRGRLLVA